MGAVGVTFICVRVGTLYGPEYTDRLMRGIARHLGESFGFEEWTDDKGGELPGWWAKMQTLDATRRVDAPCIFLDLDTLIVGDLAPLVEAARETPGLGIARNFTRAAGHPTWPCAYGSCVMTLAPGWGGDVWERFWSARESVMAACPKGDQQAIERLTRRNEVTILNDVLPPGYLVGHRDIDENGPPEGAAVVCFGGARKPHNSPYLWVREAWV